MVFAVYLILLAAAIIRHEPWMDEAQAWLLAKDAGVAELFVKYLRYEGSPGLWHLILMIPAKLGLPYFTINVLSATFSAFGVWLFLRRAPFPAIIKILFPFTYFTFFQYGVVARSYCLIAPLLFLIAINYEKKIERPFLFVALLCLLANVSTHAFLISGALVLIHVFDVFKLRKRLDKPTKSRQILAVLIFALMSALLFLVLLPPSDHFVAEKNNWNVAHFFYVGKLAISGALTLDESSRMLWLQSAAALPVFVLTLFWLHRKNSLLLYLLPLTFVVALLAVKYWNFWHEGILFLLWIFALWISFDKDNANEWPELRKIVVALMSAVLAVQVCWSFYAVRYDFFRNYSGSYEIAEYIKANHLENKKIFASGWKSISILPYFEENIFDNHNGGAKPRFWLWSANENQTAIGLNDQIVESIKSQQPDIVIFASDHLDADVAMEAIEIEGYRFANKYEGDLCWKTGIYEMDSYWIFIRKER